jgi:hypothetical protein
LDDATTFVFTADLLLESLLIGFGIIVFFACKATGRKILVAAFLLHTTKNLVASLARLSCFPIFNSHCWKYGATLRDEKWQ